MAMNACPEIVLMRWFRVLVGGMLPSRRVGFGPPKAGL
jgi:hypothetical protein